MAKTDWAESEVREIKTRKQALRNEMARIRERVHDCMKQRAGAMLVALAGDLVEPGCGRVVSGFYPFRGEIDSLPLLQTMGDAGWVTCLPVVVARDAALMFKRWRRGEPTRSGCLGTMEPVASAPVVEPDLLLIPLLAFDRFGHRLGYGAGAYDRTVERLRRLRPVVTVGLAYSAQEVACVPNDSEDQRLDRILTENGFIELGS
ncbi:MAG: 5-formyltetrahydrofolate cyclo-ligase [Hyphomicrobiales bacterium]